MRGWAGCQDRRKRAEVQKRAGVGWGFRAAFGGGRGEQDRVRDGGSLSGTPRL